MAYSEILFWLKSERNYSTGVNLLEANGGNAAVVALCRSGENSFTRTKLITELQRLADGMEAREAEPVFMKSKEPGRFIHDPGDYKQLSESKHAYIDVNQLPESLKRDWIKKADLTREQGALHNSLFFLKDKDDLLAAGLRILDIEDERSAIWKRIDYYQKHGKLPDEKGTTLLDLISQRDALGVKISKHGKKPEYAARVEEWKKQKEELHQLVLKHNVVI